MTKSNEEQKNMNVTFSKDYVTILITTQEHIIKGKLNLPIPGVVENPTSENLLFYALNCGNMFIALRDCVIMHKENVEYLPTHIKYYNINLNIVHSCQIIEDDE